MYVFDRANGAAMSNSERCFSQSPRDRNAGNFVAGRACRS